MINIILLIISKIRLDGGTNLRANMDESAVMEFVDATIRGATFPPVVVFRDEEGELWLADGFYRVYAMQQAGRNEIEADVRAGSQRDAILYSAGANTANLSVRYTTADKQKAVAALLADLEWEAWSDRKIARHCAVDKTMVGRLRREMSATVNGRPAKCRAKDTTEETVTDVPVLNITGASDAEEEDTRLSRAEELQLSWNVESGQLWEIPSATVPGKSHLLLCGDCTDPRDSQRLMQDRLADLLHIDSPYGVNVASSGRYNKNPRRPGSTLANDDLSAAQFEDFLRSAFSNSVQHVRPGGAYYVWHAASKVELFAKVTREILSAHRSILVWIKNHFVVGWQDYFWQHESCFYGSLPGATRVWLGRNNVTTILKAESVGADFETGVHPSAKPVGLAVPLIERHVAPGGLIYEPFAGSGTTFAAAEKTGRLCAGLEIKPVFCAVILERMARLGLTPRLLEDSSNCGSSSSSDDCLAA